MLNDTTITINLEDYTTLKILQLNLCFKKLLTLWFQEQATPLDVIQNTK